jgi:hypothetical protein
MTFMFGVLPLAVPPVPAPVSSWVASGVLGGMFTAASSGIFVPLLLRADSGFFYRRQATGTPGQP